MPQDDVMCALHCVNHNLGGRTQADQMCHNVPHSALVTRLLRDKYIYTGNQVSNRFEEAAYSQQECVGILQTVFKIYCGYLVLISVSVRLWVELFLNTNTAVTFPVLHFCLIKS